MVGNVALPTVRVDPATLQVTIDDEPITAEPAREVPLNRMYMLG
jgi:urease subunit alpha